MATNSGDKIPVEIVTTVIDTIAAFTKETEVLRSQIPTKESMEALNGKVDRAALTIKTFFAVIAIVVAMSFFGAQIIDWVRSDTTAPNVSQQMLDDKLKEQRDEYAKQLEQFQKDIINDIKQLNELNNNPSNK